MSLSLETWIHCPTSVSNQRCRNAIQSSHARSSPLARKQWRFSRRKKNEPLCIKKHLQPLKGSAACTNSKCGSTPDLWLHIYIQVDGKSGDIYRVTVGQDCLRTGWCRNLLHEFIVPRVEPLQTGREALFIAM